VTQTTDRHNIEPYDLHRTNQHFVSWIIRIIIIIKSAMPAGRKQRG